YYIDCNSAYLMHLIDCVQLSYWGEDSLPASIPAIHWALFMDYMGVVTHDKAGDSKDTARSPSKKRKSTVNNPHPYRAEISHFEPGANMKFVVKITEQTLPDIQPGDVPTARDLL